MIKEEKKARICTIERWTLEAIIENCQKSLERKNIIYLGDVANLLEKALEGIAEKSDLTDGEKLDIKKIRSMIKGL